MRRRGGFFFEDTRNVGVFSRFQRPLPNGGLSFDVLFAFGAFDSAMSAAPMFSLDSNLNVDSWPLFPIRQLIRTEKARRALAKCTLTGADVADYASNRFLIRTVLCGTMPQIKL